ncbi:MAG: NnrS family protein [Gammaproteobacteria bacterium]|nr:NnrS family protein [Gammaproteobacteria bacterium]
MSEKTIPGKAPTFLSYAFRPFFLLNGLFAIIVMLLWLMALHGAGPASLPADVLLWHGHEMLVGFAMAAIAGFVLTAVATWTDRPPLSGAPLGLLVAAWLTGRGAMLLGGLLPAWLVGLLDLVFPVLLFVLVGREIVGGGNRRNYPIIGITVLLALLDLVYHLGASQVLPGADRLAVYLLIHLVLLLITVIAGRIVPNFSANWLRAHGHTRLPINSTPIDLATIVLTLLTGVSASVAPTSVITGVLAFAAAFMHGLRLSRWRGLATTKEPLLFALHVAYLWLPVGYVLTAFSVFGWLFPATAALHALTMGGVGSMILAVTTRVALAHTGRPLHAARMTVIAYGVFTVAVFIRVLGPLFAGGSLAMIDLSALGWIVTFAIFSWVYWPVLTGPRVD